MRRPNLLRPVRALLLSNVFWQALPTPATLYFNKVRVRPPMAVPQLPNADWSRRERRALLDSSEDRLRNIEGKGPGLATVSAVIVAAVLLAISSGWDDSALFARFVLVLAAVYAVLSLVMPLYLVGPLARDTVHVSELTAAGAANDPEEKLADLAASAAMRNDLRNLRLSNLLDAARRELSYALALVLLWVLLVPVTGLQRREAPPGSQHHPRAEPAGATGSPTPLPSRRGPARKRSRPGG